MIFNRVLGPLAVCSLAAANPTPKLDRRGTIASDEIGKLPFTILPSLAAKYRSDYDSHSW